MTVRDKNGKKAITNYKTIKIFNIKDIFRPGWHNIRIFPCYRFINLNVIIQVVILL